jgi:hypothetical protein
LFQGQIGFTYAVTQRFHCTLTFSADDNRSNQRPIQSYLAAFQTRWQF